MTITKSLTDVELKADGDKGTVKALFSVFGNVDSDGDVVAKGAFEDGAKVVISAYGHTSWDGTLPVGKGVISETDRGAVLDGQFFMNTAHGADAFHTVKALADDGLQEWSYSLHDVQSERGKVDGVDVRVLKKITVKEVSPVLKGANPLTETLSVKSADLTFSDHCDAVLTAVDDLTKRALEVVTLRIAQGKACPSVDELLDELDARVKALRDGRAVIPNPLDDFDREYLRFVALQQGLPLP